MILENIAWSAFAVFFIIASIVGLITFLKIIIDAIKSAIEKKRTSNEIKSESHKNNFDK